MLWWSLAWFLYFIQIAHGHTVGSATAGLSEPGDNGKGFWQIGWPWLNRLGGRLFLPSTVKIWYSVWKFFISNFFASDHSLHPSDACRFNCKWTSRALDLHVLLPDTIENERYQPRNLWIKRIWIARTWLAFAATARWRMGGNQAGVELEFRYTCAMPVFTARDLLYIT